MLSFVTVNSDVGRALWYTTKARYRRLFFYSVMGSLNSLGVCWICCCRYRWRGIVHVYLLWM